jgi:DNA (cytosine-5)-methyltransferase 1
MSRITAKGYFSGAGGMELGLMEAGIDVVQSLDLDRDAIDCMNQNFGHSVLHKDIKDILVNNQDKTHIIVGTYPCTKYSPIADIHGTRTGDDLFLHFFRHIAIEKPEMYVVENVPGMKKFPVVMEAMTQLPDYYVNVVCPVETTNWLPQKRNRLIIIGSRKPFSISHPESSKRISIRDIIEKDADVEIPDYVRSRMSGKYRDRPIIVDSDDPSAVAPTCVAHYSKDLGTRMVKVGNNIRPFSVREYARLQGFPDWFKFPERRSSYKLIGNAVPVPMGRWVGENVVKYFS